jgi:sterol desaturase/sphingolipid hydroxylase (fatty acid hydroxylase superfamily)
MSGTLTFATHRAAALAVAAVFILMELLWLRQRGIQAYDWRETATSTVVMIGQIASRALSVVLLTPLLFWVYQHRLFELRLDRVWSIAGLFLGIEFLYYCFHRASHRVRWLWATHAVHHSSEHLNFSAAYRLGWTNMLSGGWLFFLPLVWLGYSPVAVFGLFAANLAYQFFLHTELVGRLGPLEWVFNTPAHHRVHHSADTDLLDRNFGGTLVIFDHLFGTYADEPRGRAMHYGLAGVPADANRYNPVTVALGEWWRMLLDLRRAHGLGQALRTAFGSP